MSGETHDYSQRMGTACCVGDTSDGGQRIRVYGWTSHRPNRGDFILLGQKDNPRQTTRYRLTDVEHCFDPNDMWMGTAEFAPRPAPDAQLQHHGRVMRTVASCHRWFSSLIRGAAPPSRSIPQPVVASALTVRSPRAGNGP